MTKEKYKPLNGWTKETILQKIKTGFKSRSVDNHGNCLYRNGENKCAVGLFIPDSKYEESTMEGLSVEYLLIKNPDIEGDMPLPLKALREMQTIHDASFLETGIANSDGWALDNLLTFVEDFVEGEVKDE